MMRWILKLATGSVANPMLLVWLVAGAFGFGLVTGAVPAWKYQAAQKEAVQAEYDGFVAQTTLMGEQAKKEADAQKAADKKLKERTDASHKNTVDKLNADIKRLRAQSSSGEGGLRTPGPLAGSPERICFDPTKFDAALRGLDESVLGIVETGSKAVVDLDTAKTWAATTHPEIGK